MKIIAGTVAALVLLALSGCSASQEAADGPVTAPANTPRSASATPTPTPTPTQDPLGTRAQPYPAGQTAKYDSSSVWAFTWTSTKGDGWPDIQAANEYNTAPPAGTNFVLGNMNIRAEDAMPADGGDPIASFAISYVGSDGNTYRTESADCGLLPGTAEYQVGKMYANATKDATVCAAVPSDAVAGGTWLISSNVEPDSSVYFAGA